MQIPIEIDMYGEQIRGIIHIPKYSSYSNRIYVMCYGYNGDMCEVHRITRKFGMICEEKGCILVRFDYRGHGHSNGNSSEILFDRKVDDTEAVMNFVEGCMGKKCNFTLIGFSDGAKIAIEVMKRKSVKKLILWNPILNMESVSKIYNNQHGKVKRIYTDIMTGKRVTNLFGLSICLKYLNEIMKINKEDELLQCEQTVICIWGGNDNYTRQLRELVLRQMNINISSEVIEGAAHLFGKENHQKELFRITLEEKE